MLFIIAGVNYTFVIYNFDVVISVDMRYRRYKNIHHNNLHIILHRSILYINI